LYTREEFPLALHSYNFGVASSRNFKNPIRWFGRGSQNHHHPPGVNQHQQDEHVEAQPIFSACLLVAYTQIFYGSLEFIFYPFHVIYTSKKYEFLFCKNSNEEKVKMSQRHIGEMARYA
jgi:hypothetical protein